MGANSQPISWKSDLIKWNPLYATNYVRTMIEKATIRHKLLVIKKLY